jgi:hypothetical protein
MILDCRFALRRRERAKRVGSVASLWDVATEPQIGSTLTAGNGREIVDLSPDGRRLLLTHADGDGALYDVDPSSSLERACTLANRTLTPEEGEEFLAS